MKSYRKFVRLAMIPGLVLLGIGCGGITASRSISPATFLLPGLLQYTPETNAPNALIRGPEVALLGAKTN
ncbi:MAG TPA: hypothetical protein VFA77_12565 [Candidatus Eisenbacteria bacterium]|jgi:hypothetical protein|nr:hypothetical protein [Candidatus Eisenbacteria bacterium]